MSDVIPSKQRVNRWSPRSRHGVHLVLANPYAGEREEWYPNDCHSLIDARDHDEIVGGLRAEIERLTELLDRKSSVAYEDAQDRVAAETTGDGWIACSDRMPTHGLKVMAYFRNKLGKGRTVFANHIEKFKERADNYEIDPDTPDDWFDTDESGESYIPEGWYENSETHEQELAITDEILFWRPLLSPPEQVKTSVPISDPSVAGRLKTEPSSSHEGSGPAAGGADPFSDLPVEQS
jgi:hypothetical protein